MINHRIASSEACSRMFNAKDHGQFDHYLEIFLGQISDMSVNGQYLMIGNSLDIFDSHLLDAKCTNAMGIRICESLPISLKASIHLLQIADKELAEAIAHNISKHANFNEKDQVYIEDVVREFGVKGYMSSTVVILDALFNIPRGGEEFDYQGFLDTLYHGFDDNCLEIISWAIGFEQKLLETNFPEHVCAYAKQYMGNKFFKMGMKGLGAIIMEDTADSSKGVELHERRQFLGIRMTPETAKSVEVSPLTCYLLGADHLEPEWFTERVDNISGSVISYSIEHMRRGGYSVSQDSLEKVFAIAIANSKTHNDIAGIELQMLLHDICLSKELADLAMRRCIVHFLKSPSSIIAIMNIAKSLGAEINFVPFEVNVFQAINEWCEGGGLSIGDICACFFKSVNQFPLTHKHVAAAVEKNWSSWGKKERMIAVNTLPREVFNLSYKMKGMKLEDDLGM